VSAFASLAEKKDDGAAAVKARHTAFLRGVGTANQERALRRRLERHGYVPLDEAPPPRKRKAAPKDAKRERRRDGAQTTRIPTSEFRLGRLGRLEFRDERRPRRRPRNKPGSDRRFVKTRAASTKRGSGSDARRARARARESKKRD
jgi:hypothetical protein